MTRLEPISHPSHRVGFVLTDASTTGDDEADVIARAQLDRQAFAPLYARYAPAVFRYCRARLESHEAAEDATSQVFARVLAALPRYRAESFRGWLFTIAHNVVADQHRGRRNHTLLDVAVDLTDDAASPEETALTAEAAREVRHLLALLPDRQRRVVELRLAGLSAVEVAEVVGRGVSAVRMDQLRAFARLREALVGLGVDKERPGER